MSIKLPTLSKKFWIAAFTLLVIGAMFAYYLLVYVDLREKKLREDKYRALARYGENMVNTRDDYSNAIGRSWLKRDSIVNVYRREYADTLRFAKNKINESFQKGNQSSKDDNLRIKKLDSLQEKINKITKGDLDSGFWKIYRSRMRNDMNFFIQLDLPNVRYDGYFNKSEFDSIAHKNFERIYFTYLNRRPGRDDRFGVFSIGTSVFAYRPDQFDQFFIIKKFDESKHEHKTEIKDGAHETFQTFQNRISLATIDSFLIKEKGLLTSRFGEIVLADTKYKLFVHSSRFSEEESWLLCGLMKTENYNNQIRSVSPLLITSAILLVLFLIVGMPILKLLIMNTYERLTIANVWLSGFSVVCGSAVLFLMIWSGSHNLQSNNQIDEKLEGLSDHVKRNFQKELANIYRQLDFMNNDTFPEIVNQLKAEIICAFQAELERKKSLHNKDSIISPSSIRVIGKFLDRVKSMPSPWREKVLMYLHFNYVLWIEETGQPTLTLTTLDKPYDYQIPNLSKRKYFSWVKKDSTWYLPVDTLMKSSFALQSIQSWTNHLPEAGFGINSLSKKIPARVLAMSTRLHSIMDPALPLGYGFCIIDESGEVWFHSDTKKNHQENIFFETNHHDKFTAVVKGRGKTHFSTSYAGHQSRLYVQPIDNIPLYLVVFHDKDYQRTPVAITIFFAFGLMTILFAVQGTQMLVLFICEYKSRKLKIKHFFLKVLRPDSDHEDMYRKSIGGQCILLGLSLVLYEWGYFATVLGFITLPVMLMVFHQILYHANDSDHGAIKRRDKIFLSLSVAIIILVNVLAFRWMNGQEKVVVIVQQLVFALVLSLCMPKKVRRKLLPEKINRKISSLVNRWPNLKAKRNAKILQQGQEQSKPKQKNLKFQKFWSAGKYPGNYYAYLMLWLILISLFPVAYFYKMAHWQESLLWAKYQQLEDRETMFKRKKILDQALPVLSANFRDYPDSIGNYLPQSRNLSGAENHCADKFQEVLFEAWPRLPDPFNISSAASFNEATDKKWTWHKTSNEVQIEYDATGRGAKISNYTSTYGGFNPFDGEYGFWFFLLTVLSVYMLARLICFTSKYIFGIGIIPVYNSLSPTDLITKINKASRIFITGLPGSEKNKLLDKSCKDFCIRNFEMGLNDHESNQKRLNDLEAHLMNPEKPKIVILSAVQPSAIVEVYRKWIRDGAQETVKPETQKDNLITAYKIALRKWKNVLSKFEVYYTSIQPNAKEFSKDKTVSTELDACYYLQNVGKANKMEQGLLNEEDFILNVEEIAEPYYNSLWNSFSQDEKLVLFDLARDGFVNLKNQRTIRILMQKGVVVIREHSLDIMNKSFTNFILNVFREDEEIDMIKNVQSKGSWQNIQLVLVLVLIAIVAFIALAQKELISNLNAFILALTGAFGFLSKFGGLFGSGTKAKE